MSDFGWSTREPCGSCPYRRDVPRGIWHPEHFVKLLREEQDGDNAANPVYGCHATLKAKRPEVWVVA